MGPLVFLPVAALALFGLFWGNEPPPPAPQTAVSGALPTATIKGARKTPVLSVFLATYQCGLYNRLRAIDALPKKQKYRFVILDVDGKQKYDQAWLYEDHKTVYVEVSSMFYRHKDEQREFWSQPVEDAIARSGFNLETGQSGNYNFYLRQPDVRQLWDVAGLMLSVAYTAFDAGEQPLRVKSANSKLEELPPGEVCAYSH